MLPGCGFKVECMKWHIKSIQVLAVISFFLVACGTMSNFHTLVPLIFGILFIHEIWWIHKLNLYVYYSLCYTCIIAQFIIISNLFTIGFVHHSLYNLFLDGPPLHVHS